MTGVEHEAWMPDQQRERESSGDEQAEAEVAPRTPPASPARPRNEIGAWGDSLGGSWREAGLADLDAKWDQ